MNRDSRRDGEGHFPQSLHHPEGLPPENALVAAILRQVLIDIGQKRPTSKKSGGWISLGEQIQAIEWILDLDSVAFFADLLGLEGPWLQRALLVEAGLTTSLPRKGQSS